MDKGRIAESGIHEELLAGGGVYAEIWNTQQRLERYGNIQGVNMGEHSAGAERGNMGKDGAAI